MVNAGFTMSERTLTDLALDYAPVDVRGAIAALFRLDRLLGGILRTTTQPMVGQMRLAWWREALERLDTLPPPAEPVLRGLADDVMPLGISGARLAAMIDGWEALLDTLDDTALHTHAEARGATLFALASTICGVVPDDRIAAAGRGWALADLKDNVGDPDAAARAALLARAALGDTAGYRWPVRVRALGALALVAGLSLDGAPSAWWVARLAWLRATGR